MITSSTAYTVRWSVPPTVPTSETDPTPVPHRINGFFYKVDTGTPVSIKPEPYGVCPAGTAYAGHGTYEHRVTQGVTKGDHYLQLWAWNYELDEAGNETDNIAHGDKVIAPFVAADLGLPKQVSRPQGPVNVIIRK